MRRKWSKMKSPEAHRICPICHMGIPFKEMPPGSGHGYYRCRICNYYIEV